jgi:GNAT superfamily N-acetyltransferase
MAFHIREIAESDSEAVLALFRVNYGDDYTPYDPAWVKKGIYSEHILWLVAEEEGEIVASGALVLGFGNYVDQIGKIERLAVAPKARGQGISKLLLQELIVRSSVPVEFGFAEAATTQPAIHDILHEAGFMPVGFTPYVYQLQNHEGFVLYCTLFGNASRLRRGAPRILSRVYSLAELALRGLGLPDDPIMPEAWSYPGEGNFTLQRLADPATARLLRIEHSGTIEPELFGGVHLDQGVTRLYDSEMYYLVATDSQGKHVGALGYMVDETNRHVRIIELIAPQKQVRGALCRAVVKTAESQHHALFMEVDVSAYSPGIQKTFSNLGFVPTAYLPAMVLHEVERLDIVKMARLNEPFLAGGEMLNGIGQRVYQIVAAAFSRRERGQAALEVARNTSLFLGFSEEELIVLGERFYERLYSAGETIFTAGSEGQDLYLVLEGKITVDLGEDRGPLATLRPGDIFGELALLDGQPRTANAVAQTPVRLLQLKRSAFDNLVQDDPHIGLVVYRNIAGILVSRLRRTDARLDSLTPPLEQS